MNDTPVVSAARPMTSGAWRSASAQLTVAAAGALATLVVARLLGPEGAGSYAVALSLLFGLTALGTIGLETGISYFVGSGVWEPHDAFVRTQLTALLLGVLMLLVGVGASQAFPSAFEGLSFGEVVLVAAAMPAALSWLYASCIALALDDYENFSLPPAVQAVLALVGVVGLGAAFGLTGALAGLTASHLLAAGLTFRRVRPEAARGGGARAERGSGRLRAAAQFGLKAYLANALGFLQYRLDVFILNATVASAVVGGYAVAVSVTSAMFLLPRALSGVLLPRVARLSADDDPSQREMVETKSLRHVGLIVAVSVPLLAGVLVVLVTFFFGDGFSRAIPLGMILLPGSALMGIAGVLSATIVGRGKAIYSLYIALLTTPVAVALYAALVPPFGAEGAAIASTAAYTVTFAVTVYFYRRSTGRSVLRFLVPTRAEVADYGAMVHALRARRRTGGRGLG
jgi:O-antigen/teichoic acid export membrane protein